MLPEGMTKVSVVRSTPSEFSESDEGLFAFDERDPVRSALPGSELSSPLIHDVNAMISARATGRPVVDLRFATFSGYAQGVLQATTL